MQNRRGPGSPSQQRPSGTFRSLSLSSSVMSSPSSALSPVLAASTANIHNIESLLNVEEQFRKKIQRSAMRHIEPIYEEASDILGREKVKSRCAMCGVWFGEAGGAYICASCPDAPIACGECMMSVHMEMEVVHTVEEACDKKAQESSLDASFGAKHFVFFVETSDPGIIFTAADKIRRTGPAAIEVPEKETPEAENDEAPSEPDEASEKIPPQENEEEAPDVDSQVLSQDAPETLVGADSFLDNPAEDTLELITQLAILDVECERRQEIVKAWQDERFVELHTENEASDDNAGENDAPSSPVAHLDRFLLENYLQAEQVERQKIISELEGGEAATEAIEVHRTISAAQNATTIIDAGLKRSVADALFEEFSMLLSQDFSGFVAELDIFHHEMIQVHFDGSPLLALERDEGIARRLIMESGHEELMAKTQFVFSYNFKMAIRPLEAEVWREHGAAREELWKEVLLGIASILAWRYEDLHVQKMNNMSQNHLIWMGQQDPQQHNQRRTLEIEEDDTWLFEIMYKALENQIEVTEIERRRHQIARFYNVTLLQRFLPQMEDSARTILASNEAAEREEMLQHFWKHTRFDALTMSAVIAGFHAILGDLHSAIKDANQAVADVQEEAAVPSTESLLETKSYFWIDETMKLLDRSNQDTASGDEGKPESKTLNRSKSRGMLKNNGSFGRSSMGGSFARSPSNMTRKGTMMSRNRSISRDKDPFDETLRPTSSLTLLGADNILDDPESTFLSSPRLDQPLYINVQPEAPRSALSLFTSVLKPPSHAMGSGFNALSLMENEVLWSKLCAEGQEYIQEYPESNAFEDIFLDYPTVVCLAAHQKKEETDRERERARLQHLENRVAAKRRPGQPPSTTKPAAMPQRLREQTNAAANLNNTSPNIVSSHNSSPQTTTLNASYSHPQQHGGNRARKKLPPSLANGEKKIYDRYDSPPPIQHKLYQQDDSFFSPGFMLDEKHPSMKIHLLGAPENPNKPGLVSASTRNRQKPHTGAAVHVQHQQAVGHISPSRHGGSVQRAEQQRRTEEEAHHRRHSTASRSRSRSISPTTQSLAPTHAQQQQQPTFLLSPPDSHVAQLTSVGTASLSNLSSANQQHLPTRHRSVSSAGSVSGSVDARQTKQQPKQGERSAVVSFESLLEKKDHHHHQQSSRFDHDTSNPQHHRHDGDNSATTIPMPFTSDAVESTIYATAPLSGPAHHGDDTFYDCGDGGDSGMDGLLTLEDISHISKSNIFAGGGTKEVSTVDAATATPNKRVAAAQEHSSAIFTPRNSGAENDDVQVLPPYQTRGAVHQLSLVRQLIAGRHGANNHPIDQGTTTNNSSGGGFVAKKKNSALAARVADLSKRHTASSVARQSSAAKRL